MYKYTHGHAHITLKLFSSDSQNSIFGIHGIPQSVVSSHVHSCFFSFSFPFQLHDYQQSESKLSACHEISFQFHICHFCQFICAVICDPRSCLQLFLLFHNVYQCCVYPWGLDMDCSLPPEMTLIFEKPLLQPYRLSVFIDVKTNNSMTICPGVWLICCNLLLKFYITSLVEDFNPFTVRIVIFHYILYQSCSFDYGMKLCSSTQCITL